MSALPKPAAVPAPDLALVPAPEFDLDATIRAVLAASTTAKTRLYVVAEACVKVRTSPYRAVYDAAREHHASAVHHYPCAQCKAAAGDPLKDGHKHARAMRAVMKRIALRAWKEARIAAGLPHNKNRKARAG